MSTMASNEVCVICRVRFEEEVKMPWESGGSSSELVGSPGPGVNQALNCQLSVVLLVRKILGLSNKLLESLLREQGNPSNWGLKMCGPCRRIFLEAEYVHQRITILHEEFEGLANRLRTLLRKSEVSNPNNKESSKMEVKRTCVRRGRGHRRRRRKRPSPEESDSLENGDMTGEMPIAKVVRQGFIKGSMDSLPQIQTNKIDSSIKLRAKDKRQQQSQENDIMTMTTQSIRHTPFDQIGKIEPEIGNAALDDPLGITDVDPSAENVQKQLTDRGDSVDPDVEVTDLNENDDDGGDTYFPPSDTDSDEDQNDHEYGSKQSKLHASLQKSSVSVNKVDLVLVPQPVKQNGLYKCPLCQRSALSKSSCHGHILRAHYNSKRPFHCHLCEKKFKREVLLRTHLDQIHDGATTPLDEVNEDKPDKCTIADGSRNYVNSNAETSQDDQNVTRARRYECDQCPKMKYKVLYKSLETLEAHKKMVHMGIKRPYECKICGKCFKLNCVLNQHMYVHKRQEKEKRPVKQQTYCPQCNRQFKNNSTLKAHLKTKAHSAEYPYLCEFCTKGFFQKPSLDNHRAQEHYAELNVQPFRCSFCDKNLSGKRALDHHIRIIHTRETKFQCVDCDLGFMFENSYQKHLAVVHQKEKPLLCTYCPKRFAAKSHLETHIRTHTGEKPYKCEDCGKEYSDRPTFRRHLEIHGEKLHECSVCQKQFKVRHSYRVHMKSAHNIDVAFKKSKQSSKRNGLKKGEQALVVATTNSTENETVLFSAQIPSDELDQPTLLDSPKHEPSVPHNDLLNDIL